MKVRRALLLALAPLLLVPIVARSGHEAPVYPSFYPHEIEIRTIPPEEAGSLMSAGKLHAYIGGTPIFPSSQPKVAGIESLGSFIRIRLNPESPLARDRASACTAVEAVLRTMAERAGEAFVFHPYPVTPFHGDYLHHADRAEAERERFLDDGEPPPASLRIRAAGRQTGSLIPAEWHTQGAHWDAVIEEVDGSGIVADATVPLNGWLGPWWVRSGWFQAFRVLSEFAPEADIEEEWKTIAARLQAGQDLGAVARINLERELVEGLASSCQARVAGYTVKQEMVSIDSSLGIENLSFDAVEGLSSPMFLRTVKLKDFPWNGWLQLGHPGRPDAAWNPIAGFNDPFGRLVWYAVGDPAAIPSPYEAAWTLNRISEVEPWPRR